VTYFCPKIIGLFILNPVSFSASPMLAKDYLTSASWPLSGIVKSAGLSVAAKDALSPFLAPASATLRLFWVVRIL